MRMFTGEYETIMLSAASVSRDSSDAVQQASSAMSLTGRLTDLAFTLPFYGGGELKLSLSGSGIEPSDLWHCMDALKRLTMLPPNWDSYGAKPVTRATAKRALPTLANVVSNRIPLPAIVPMHQGGLQLEWHSDRADIELVFPSVGEPSYSFADHEGGEEGEGRGTLESARILELLGLAGSRA